MAGGRAFRQVGQIHFGQLGLKKAMDGLFQQPEKDLS
jgi:hypothetical protein